MGKVDRNRRPSATASQARGARAAGQSRGSQQRGAGQPRAGSQAKGRGNGSQGRDSIRRGTGDASPVAARADASPEPASPVASRLFQLVTLGLALAGLAVSIYLTIAHLTTATILACPDKGFVNCEAVTTSPESKLFGIFPVAELGLAFYVFMVAINSPWAWRSKLPQIYWLRVASLVVGMGFVLWLISAELLIIKNICLFCTAVHVITFALFIMIVFNATGGSAPTARNLMRLSPAARQRS